MPRLPTITLHLLRVSALAAVLTACVHTAVPGGHGDHVRRSDVAAVVGQLRREMEATMVNGRSYSLTELEQMIAAHELEDGDDAVAVWDAELHRHYRARRRAMRTALRAEVETYDRARIAAIIAARDERSRLTFLNSETNRRANLDALCDSLDSTPRAWARLYPGRARFTFRRFGIDTQAIRLRCAERDVE